MRCWQQNGRGASFVFRFAGGEGSINRTRIIGLALLITALVTMLILAGVSAEPQSIGVYADMFGLIPVTHIQWGTLTPGQTITKSIYIKNQADKPMTSLTCTMQNVTPSIAASYLQLSGTPLPGTLQKNNMAKVDLTLTINPHIHGVTDFSLNVLLTATLQEGDGSLTFQEPNESELLLPSEPEPLNISPSQLILILIVGLSVYLIAGGGRKR